MEEVTFFMLVCVSYTEVHQNSMAEGTQTLHWGQPWLRSAEPHVKPPEAPGNFQTQQNHSKEGKRLRKRALFSHFHPPPWFLGPTLQVEFALSAL